MKKSLSAKQVTWLLTLVYFTGYLTRINFASIIQSVVTETGFSKSALSAIPVCLFVAYAVGQVVNGRLGDKIQPQSLILCGLGCSSIINIVFPFCSTSIPLMCVLWGINGFVQAMLWPPIIQIMVRSMSAREYNSNVALLTIGSTGAKVAIFLLAPLVISVGGWKSVLFICSGFGIATTVAFLLLKDRIVMQPLPVSEQPAEKKQGFRLPRASVMPILFIFLAIILHGMLRDGLDTWMPSYLVEVFQFSDSSAIFSRVFLAIFGVISIMLSKRIYTRFFKNEIACALWLFGVSTLAALVLFIGFNAGAVLTIVMMMLISGIQCGINLMLISYVPKRFRHYGGISTITGLLDAFAYVGSAASTYGVAVIAENLGWRFTTGTWLGISALGLICVLVAAKPWQRFYRVHEDD